MSLIHSSHNRWIPSHNLPKSTITTSIHTKASSQKQHMGGCCSPGNAGSVQSGEVTPRIRNECANLKQVPEHECCSKYNRQDYLCKIRNSSCKWTGINPARPFCVGLKKLEADDRAGQGSRRLISSLPMIHQFISNDWQFTINILATFIIIVVVILTVVEIKKCISKQTKKIEKKVQKSAHLSV